MKIVILGGASVLASRFSTADVADDTDILCREKAKRAQKIGRDITIALRLGPLFRKPLSNRCPGICWFEETMRIRGERPVVASAPDIASYILTLRGEKVILDADLAWIYGVKTGQLNRAVKRNLDRFPEDFLFKLTTAEAMRCQSGTASRRNVRYQPYAFTEHGALMAANILSSSRAVPVESRLR